MEEALIICLVATVLVGYKDLANKIISQWVTVFFFALNSLLIIVLHQYQVIPYISISSSAVLTLVAFGTLAIGMPFTLQYAKLDVPRETWENPIFIQINKEMTFGWGLLFAVGLIKSVIEFFYNDLFGVLGDATMYITIIIGMIFTMKYPVFAKSRKLKKQTEQQGSAVN
ncbi:hypothetical protein [Methanosphaerula palustris]|uniref:Uncharacterized protein n=1 Tax=Methanosphaerula palustris (strain ATCC BAA-1556 / DSM 19958 / E1-9c) TaxID=521011 RepID=B8GE78_METPE|nr:hypothetical protein [Methanosphaerula palustris]ACL17579.1 conserved hypothetical protein [Methanosphaerula palustris E1-9c]